MQCVARWDPRDIAAGVCDLEIFDILKEREGKLLIHPTLHAKYFRSDDKCLIGSANLTERALGWNTQRNLEILLPVSTSQLVCFEEELISKSVEATEELKNSVLQKAQEIALEVLPYLPIEEVSRDFESQWPRVFDDYWIPRCKEPSNLWAIYSGYGREDIITSTRRLAEADLQFLDVPLELTRGKFNIAISERLNETDLMKQLRNFMGNSRVSSESGALFLRDVVGEEYSWEYGIDEHWEIVTDWLVYFRSSEFARGDTGYLFPGRRV